MTVNNMENDLTVQLIRAGLDIAAYQHKVASLNTVGAKMVDYTPKKLDFMLTVENKESQKVDVKLEANINNDYSVTSINVDSELIKAINSENRYNALVEMLNRTYSLKKTAVGSR